MALGLMLTSCDPMDDIYESIINKTFFVKTTESASKMINTDDSEY